MPLKCLMKYNSDGTMPNNPWLFLEIIGGRQLVERDIEPYLAEQPISP